MVTQLRQMNAPYLLLITNLEPIHIMMVNNLLGVRLSVLSIDRWKIKLKHNENNTYRSH